MGDGKGRTRNMAMEELIGRKVKVNAHTDRGLVGVDGLVLDETRKTMTIGRGPDRVVVPKKGARISLQMSDGTECVLEGDRLMFRPEDRIKRCERVPTGTVRNEDEANDH